jgi:hypothetical protein
MKSMLFVAAALAAVSVPAAAQVTTYDSNITGGFQYGSGNDYSPANATVLTNGNEELALRFHQTGQVAPASGGDGIYNFALGTSPISFDWSIGVVDPIASAADLANALITVSNVGTGQTVSYNPFFPGNDNTLTVSGDFQNSARLSFGFLLGAGFTPNIDSTYSVTLASGGNRFGRQFADQLCRARRGRCACSAGAGNMGHDAHRLRRGWLPASSQSPCQWSDRASRLTGATRPNALRDGPQANACGPLRFGSAGF